MTADIFAQFIEALACFAVGAYFGVKYAFTEVIGACSGKIIRGILQFIYGLSYFLSLGLVVYAVAGGSFHYYHFVLQFIGALAFIPISRKILFRYKKPIQKFWLRFIGSVELVNPKIVAATVNTTVEKNENTAKQKRNKIKKTKIKSRNSKDSEADNNKKSVIIKENLTTNFQHIKTENKRHNKEF